MTVQRDTVLAVVLALLALLALGVTAATLTDTVATSGSGAGTGGGSGTGSGSGDDIGFSSADSSGFNERQRQRGVPVPPICVAWLKTPLAIGGIVAAFLLLDLLVYYDTRTILGPLALNVMLGPPVFIAWTILTACGDWRTGVTRTGTMTNITKFLPQGGGGGGRTSEAIATTPSLALGLLIVLAIAVSVVLLVVSTGDAAEQAGPEASEEESTRTPNVAAVGRAAGDAADRIEAEADTGNEVYRAWVEMTDHLAVDHPESSTPAEFAAAAVDAGMDPDDVRELTGLFEEVRYGNAEATDERERRAIAALRRIEDAYADVDTEATGGDPGGPAGGGDL